MTLESFQTAEDALDFAISEEEGAIAFYTELAGKATEKALKELLLGFAEEERGHKQKLLGVKDGQRMLRVDDKVRDLKLADYLTDVQPRSDVTYQDALIIAMKKEKAAYAMYLDLSEAAPDQELAELFLGLAHEEANHKLRFELEYDNEVMREG
jgi:rubrerythrin